MDKNFSGQGTIEYLIILAIIIVIGLVVVSILISINDSEDIIYKNEKLKNRIGSSGISITDAVSDSSGYSLLDLKNNSGETLTITKIETSEGDLTYDQTWVPGNDELIDISGLCTCGTDELTKTCEFKFYYTNQLGLEKTITQTITVDCEDEISTEKPITPSIKPFKFQITTTQINQDFNFKIDDALGMKIDWGLGEGWVELEDGNSIRTKNYSIIGDYNISLKGQASRIAFGTNDTPSTLTPELLKDILTPLSNSITGINSAKFMFKDITITSFTTQNFLDGISKDITNMEAMFAGASSFNQDISNWNTSNVTNMSGVFAGASSFNQPIGNWNTQNVETMNVMFLSASDFNQPLNNWNTQNVTNMYAMFHSANSFNQPINNWNTQNVETTQSMFNDAISFNQPLNNWDTQNVENMESMFAGASDFNNSLNDWNTTNVKNMKFMFGDANSFNQPINKWNTQNVETMYAMFYYASAFNQPLNNWNTQNVKTMYVMFFYASSFDQNISTWNVTNVNECSGFSIGCPLSDANKPNFTGCTT